MTSIDSSQKLENELLAIRCQLGEAAAFDELVERWHGPLWKYIQRMLRDKSVAEEVHQDVWLKILRGIDRLRAPERLIPWMFSIARISVLDRLRSRYTESVEVPLGEEVPAEESDPVLEIGESELLHDAVETLPLSEKEVLALFYLRELSLSEVAAVLEIPVGTVKSRLHRARTLLRKKLEEKGVTR